MRAIGRWIGIVGCAATLAGCYVPPSLPPGAEAPPFRGKAQDKEHYSLLDLTRRGPVVVAFLSRDGARTAESLDYLGLFAKAYGGRASLIGVLDVDEPGLSAWAGERSLSFPVIPDVDGSIARKYGVEMSPTLVLVGRNGALVERWTGLSRDHLRALNEALGKQLSRPPAGIAVDNAPAAASPGDLIRR